MKKSVLTLALVASLSGFSVAPLFAGNVDPASLPQSKRSVLNLYITAKDAYEKKKIDKNVIFIDVRSPEELQYVGNPEAMLDANVPLELNDLSGFDAKAKQYKLQANDNFVANVEEAVAKKGGNKDSEIILMCRSGNRSASGVDLLAKAGYTKVYNILDGFEGDKVKEGENKGKRVIDGWKNSSLPWGYKMDQDKMYYITD